MELIVLVSLFAFMYYYRYYLSSYSRIDKTVAIPALLRQTARWAVASKQDSSNLIALLHIDYAIGYLSSLQEIASNEDIKHYGGVDPSNLMKRLQARQDTILSASIKECPSFSPTDSNYGSFKDVLKSI